MNRAKRSVTQTGAHTTNEENQMTHVLTQTAAPKFGRRQSIFKTVVTWLLDLDQGYRSKQHVQNLTAAQLADVGLSREDVDKG